MNWYVPIRKDIQETSFKAKASFNIIGGVGYEPFSTKKKKCLIMRTESKTLFCPCIKYYRDQVII